MGWPPRPPTIRGRRVHEKGGVRASAGARERGSAQALDAQAESSRAPALARYRALTHFKTPVSTGLFKRGAVDEFDDALIAAGDFGLRQGGTGKVAHVLI